MRDEVYVGALISERGLEHSTGLWKKHKYIKKIGDRYYYTKEQLKNAGKGVSDKIDELRDPLGNKEAKYRKAATSADNDYKGLVSNDGRPSDSWQDEKKESFRRNRENAREAYKDYSKTAKGRLEKAAKTVGNKLTYRKRLSDAAGRSFQKSVKDTMNARNERVTANEYGRNAKTGMDHLSYTGHGKLSDHERKVYSDQADRANARADKLEKRATVNKRLQYARQSEYERTSLKARSERAKKRLEQAFGKARRNADNAIGLTARKNYNSAKKAAVRTYDPENNDFNAAALSRAKKASADYRKTALGRIENNNAVRRAKRVASAFEVHVDTGAEARRKHEKIKRAAQASNERARKQKQERKQSRTYAHERARKRVSQALKSLRRGK